MGLFNKQPDYQASAWLSYWDGPNGDASRCFVECLGEETMGICCGGGGYGPPEARSLQLVSEDVAERWITRERARSLPMRSGEPGGRGCMTCTHTRDC
jgi:hypothetical protein